MINSNLEKTKFFILSSYEILAMYLLTKQSLLLIFYSDYSSLYWYFGYSSIHVISHCQYDLL